MMSLHCARPSVKSCLFGDAMRRYRVFAYTRRTILPGVFALLVPRLCLGGDVGGGCEGWAGYTWKACDGISSIVPCLYCVCTCLRALSTRCFHPSPLRRPGEHRIWHFDAYACHSAQSLSKAGKSTRVASSAAIYAPMALSCITI